MPNAFKYSTGSETLALKKGNFYIGKGDVGKGPTSSTGYYNGITPPSGGYTIYLNKETGGPSIYTASNDEQLISLTNSIASESFTGAQQCFNYFYSQTDKVLVNQDYPADYPYIVMDGLILNLDAGITQSYPGSGTTWSDVNGLGPKNNGTLTNGPTFNSDNGGSIVFDISDDYVPVSGMENYEYTNGITVSIWHYNSGAVRYRGVVTNGDFTGDRLGGFDLRYGRENYFVGGENNGTRLAWRINTNIGNIVLNIYSNSNEWHNYVGTFDNTISKTYKDGEFWNSGSTTTSQLKTKSSSTTIGLSPNTSEYLDGKLAIVQIYNRVLTDAEILQNFNAQKGRFGL